MPTVRAALGAASERLRLAGVESSGRDARLIMASVLGVDLAATIGHPERRLAAEQAARFEQLVERRCERRPLSQILGRREFWGLSLRVTGDTLDPRPDSEILIEAALARTLDRRAPLRLLDLGTGTGCLLLALLHELPAATGVGVDSSEAALAVARENAAELGLAGRAAFRLGDWFEDLAGSYDMIVSNPPYIRTDEIPALAPEVARHEPRLALDGGRDGLDCYRRLAEGLPEKLTARGIAVLEVGTDRHDEVDRILSQGGLAVIDRKADLAGHVRGLIVGRKPLIKQLVNS
ncbi:MAG: peptide chain release factor N(5)-glutamine methyltransferase [Dongiaceae bacterium]